MARPRRLKGNVINSIEEKPNKPHHIKDAIPWSQEIKDKVKDLYYNFTPTKEITKQTTVPGTTINSWAHVYKWSHNRKLNQDKFVEEVTNKKKGHLIRIVDMCAEGLEAVIEHKLRSRDLDMQDAKFFASVLTDLTKVYRLDSGQATSITEDRSITANLNLTDKNNIKKIIGGDPMVELENLVSEQDEDDSIDTEFNDEP